jgi:hypothetical protein
MDKSMIGGDGKMQKMEDLIEYEGAYDVGKDVYKLSLKLSPKAVSLIADCAVKTGTSNYTVWRGDGDGSKEQATRYLVKRAIAGSYEVDGELGALFDKNAIDTNADSRVILFPDAFKAETYLMREVRVFFKQLAEARLSMSRTFSGKLVLMPKTRDEIEGEAENSEIPENEEGRD